MITTADVTTTTTGTTTTSRIIGWPEPSAFDKTKNIDMNNESKIKNLI